MCRDRCAKGYRTSVPRALSASASWRLMAERQCVDVNECEEGLHQCAYRCENTPGSYNCVCPPGYAVSSTDRHRCVDVDECRLGVCPPNTPCINLPGTYFCGCPVGYVGKSNTLDTHNSSENENFVFLLSKQSRKLLHSLELFQKDPENSKNFISLTDDEWKEPLQQLRDDVERHSECVDINECAVLDVPICPETSVCVNQKGSFRCNCPSGYRPALNSNHIHKLAGRRLTPYAALPPPSRFSAAPVRDFNGPTHPRFGIANPLTLHPSIMGAQDYTIRRPYRTTLFQGSILSWLES